MIYGIPTAKQQWTVGPSRDHVAKIHRRPNVVQTLPSGEGMQPTIHKSEPIGMLANN